MILPSKHRGLARSLVGIGGVLIQHLEQPLTVSALWENVSKYARGSLNLSLTFSDYTASLDFLFLLGVIRIENGLLIRERTNVY